MVKMVQKVAPWLPFNIGKVKSEGIILTGKCINLATGLSRKGRTYFSDPTKTINRGFTSLIVLFDDIQIQGHIFLLKLENSTKWLLLQIFVIHLYIQCSEISLFYLQRNTENITFELVRELSNIRSILLSIERYIATGKGGVRDSYRGGIFTQPDFKGNL